VGIVHPSAKALTMAYKLKCSGINVNEQIKKVTLIPPFMEFLKTPGYAGGH
jgi:hypothetical protein